MVKPGCGSLKVTIEGNQQKVKDSLQKAKEKIEQELKKIDNKTPGTTARAENDRFVLPVYNPLGMIVIR